MDVPQPPVHTAIDPVLQVWVTGAVGAVAVLTLLFSVVHWRRSGSPLFLLLFVSGGACMLLEPMVDFVAACWHPQINQWTVFTAFGRPMPLWLCLCYFVYFGLGSGLIGQAMARGASRTAIWSVFVLGMVADTILEIVLLNLDVYYYYGYQPLVVAQFPLWAAPQNSVIAVAAAAVAFRSLPHLPGWRVVLIVPLTVSVSAAVNCAVGWPSWLVINTPMPWVLTQLGGVATFALAAWLMTGIVWLTTTRPDIAGSSIRLLRA